MSLTDKGPPCSKRVEMHTDQQINDYIKNRTIENIDKFVGTDINTISDRIDRLDREWDTERVVEAKAASLILISTVLGFTTSKKWFLASGLASVFLLQHALQGWCPSLPVIRRMGIRTPDEIYDEKAALKYLRGDFSKVEGKPLGTNF